MTKHHIGALRISRLTVVATSIGAFALACEQTPGSKETAIAAVPATTGLVVTVRDTMLASRFSAAGVAEPVQQATLSTKLMGTVTDVLVKEGDRVAAGQPLVRIDARDLTAKSAQAAASIVEAEAVQREAFSQANRIRALYADSAAPRAQLDAVETELARADAALHAARAAGAELESVRSYAQIRAPFAGIVAKRFVDPGAFAAPGAPLVTIQDAARLRITVSATPDVARRLRPGDTVAATIEGQPARATLEGVVPALTGNLYRLNALVPNPGAAILAGSVATLELPTGTRRAFVVPTAAIVREGDLTGVTLRTSQGDERRWVRLGRTSAETSEVVAGLRAGDRVVIPTRAAAAAGN